MNCKTYFGKTMLAVILLALPVSGQQNVSPPDFNRDIRPILSNHCYQCHGQDEDTRESGLRLDVRADAISMGAISPGSVQESELLHRVISAEPDVVMPPPETNKPLSPKQIKLLQDWVSSGAEYANHWSFEPVVSPEVPSVPENWAGDTQNEIDHFIARELSQRGFVASPKADRETLIRRLYQDLIGLLPTVKEVDAFVNDSSPKAYANLVNQLLDSPHYGERWGRHWLDQARYSDSNGYTIDGSRVMWPYREWVINAINNDMPFDQFTIEQLAGDLLTAPEKSQLVATAFHRNTMINEEGGVKADEFKHEATIDRVNTTGAVWLGLTVGCAQCHSHKFDPLSHDEYYQFYAFFNQAADANNRGKTINVAHGEMLGWSDAQERQLNELKLARKKLTELETEISKTEAFEGVEWDWQQANISDARTDEAAIFRSLPDGSLLANGSFAPEGTYRIELKSNAEQLTAVRLRLLPDPSLPSNGPGRANNGNIVLTDVELEIGSKTYRFASSVADHSQPGYPVTAAIDNDNQTGWAINVDGHQRKQGMQMNARHEAIFALGQPASIIRHCTDDHGTDDHGTDDQGTDDQSTGAQSTDQNAVVLVLKHELHETYQIGRFCIDVSSAASREMDTIGNLIQNADQLRKRISTLETELPGGGTTVDQMVMADQARPLQTYRLKRGNFLTPATEEGPLTPGIPSILETGSISEFTNRLDLARWIVDPSNPLTARVTVNRVWAKFFGRGLVETENDFGLQGSLPTHPELLDWLAAEFMSSGWLMKRLHRTIVNSATYRQSSSVDQEQYELDPRNQWLGRQSRFRVEAEIVRDQALSASGLLNETLGGPSVFPPQPDGVFDFTQRKLSWPTESGPDRYRRTMYTTFYRSAPYPLLTTFDAPDFSATCTARVRSNSPLQALATANDSMFIEYAIALGRAAETMLDDDDILNENWTTPAWDKALTEMFRKCLSRTPQPQELRVLRQLYETSERRFVQDLAACRDFIDSPSAPLAAWTTVARVLLNTDEFLTRN